MEYVIFKPHLPFMIEIDFNLGVVSIISLCIFGKGKLITEDDILFLILFVASFSYFLGEVFYERKSIQAYDTDINCFSCISIA